MLKRILVLSFLFIILATQVQAKSSQAYRDFGGKKAIERVVNDLILGLISDKRVKRFFKTTNKKVFKLQLINQFCELLGGPCKYQGQSMKKAHKGKRINEKHFYALVEQLQISMDNNRIPSSAQNKLLAKLAPMYRDIVTK